MRLLSDERQSDRATVQETCLTTRRLAAVSGAFWLVANALERDPSLSADAARYGNVRMAEAAFGAGVYEAVVTTLAEGRG